MRLRSICILCILVEESFGRRFLLGETEGKDKDGRHHELGEQMRFGLLDHSVQVLGDTRLLKCSPSARWCLSVFLVRVWLLDLDVGAVRPSITSSPDSHCCFCARCSRCSFSKSVSAPSTPSRKSRLACAVSSVVAMSSVENTLNWS